MPVAFDFSNSFDEDIHCCKHASQAVLSSHCALNWLLLAFLDDHQ